MRIEINAGGLAAGVAVAEYQDNIDSFISDVDNIISGFKAVTQKVCDLAGGVGSLQSAVDDISQRIWQEESKKEAAVVVQTKSNGFLELAMRVDKQVAAAVNQNREEFYQTNPWLKPPPSADELPWYEQAWNWACSTGEQIATGLQNAWDWTKDTANDVWDWTKDTASDAWDWTKDTAKKAWNGVIYLYDAALANYNNHGWVYYVWEVGEVLWKVSKASVKVAGALAAFSTGVGIPIAILDLISAADDVVNAAADTAYLITGQHEMVGKTEALKNLLINNAGMLGEMLGNKEIGEKAGELIYYGIDLVSFFDGADKLRKSFGKLNTNIYGYTGYSRVWGWTTFDDALGNEFSGLSELKLEKLLKGTLLGIDPSSTIGLISDVLDNIYSVYDEGSDTVKDIVSVFYK